MNTRRTQTGLLEETARWTLSQQPTVREWISGKLIELTQRGAAQGSLDESQRDFPISQVVQTN